MIRRTILAACTTLVVAAACGGDDASSTDVTVDAPDTGAADGDAGDADVIVVAPTVLGDADGGLIIRPGAEIALTFTRGDDTLLEWPLAGFEVGVVPSVDDSFAYDPYFLEDGADFADLHTPPAGLTWRGASRLDTVDGVTATAATLSLSLDGGGRLTVVVTRDDAGRFRVRWNAAPTGGVAVYFRLSVRADAAEGFYGLGEVFDSVDHRGRLRAMQLEPAPLESAYNEAHVPIPLLIGTRGWGLFVDSYRPGVFAVARSDDRTVRVTYGLGPAHVEGLDMWLFAAAHPLDVTRHYYAVTGFPGAVARWALGPWLWRDEASRPAGADEQTDPALAGQALVEEDIASIRALDLAATGYWIDRPYASGVNSFDFAAADYPDPPAMFAAADAAGLAMALWHAPYVDPDDPDTVGLYDDAVAAGYFPPIRGTALGPWGPPLDFTNADAVDWWQALLSPYIALGVRGFKLDYGEEVVAGAFGVRLPWAFDDGSDELTMHRRYQLGYHRAYAELLPGTGGFLLARAGAHRDQVNGVIIWPGDIDATMLRHGQEGTDDEDETYVSVGGLPAAVIAGSSLGPSGFPLFASDTGGYRHAPPDRETYVRWFQQTALSPVMQVGTNTNDLPWEFGSDRSLDAEMLGWYRDYARLHLRLWPYVWTYWRRVADDGRAIQRPLGLAHPELGVHPDDVYLLGDHLLVAPVVTHGARNRAVPLPAGVWRDWWTGRRQAGPTTVAVDAPLDRIPLFVREGAVIPLLRPTIDTLLPAGEGVDSYATEAGPLWVRTTPGEAGSFTLFDGTVVSQALTQTGSAPGRIALARDGGDELGGVVVFEVFGVASPPASVTADGAALVEIANLASLAEAEQGWAYDEGAAGGTLWVKLAAGTDGATIQLP